ncbi:hypothetical protein ABUK73_04060 [Agrobacterium sp. BA1120]|uniref:hypothetical protein n=1 Tax=Agrobacterium sp. BA1120 TaxID=3228927 RepID=UPI00336AA653
MTNTDTIFDAISTPVYAGAAIVLLLSVRQMESWRTKRGHHVKPDAARRDGPVRVLRAAQSRKASAF